MVRNFPGAAALPCPALPAGVGSWVPFLARHRYLHAREAGETECEASSPPPSSSQCGRCRWAMGEGETLTPRERPRAQYWTTALSGPNFPVLQWGWAALGLRQLPREGWYQQLVLKSSQLLLQLFQTHVPMSQRPWWCLLTIFPSRLPFLFIKILGKA